MKLNKYIWLAALPMLFTACQEDALVENHQGLEGKFVLKASVDKEGSFSRAQIKLEEQEDGRKFGAFQWDEGDGFRMFEVTSSRDEYEKEVFTVGDSHLFEISEYSNESPSTSATFVSETTPTDGTRFYAYYPSLDVNEDGETITMTLDSTLTSNSADAWKEYFNKNMYMMAEGEIRGTETKLYFQHLCGLINVSYTNESSTSKYIKGISVDGKWRTSGKVYVYNRWNCVKETLDEDGYGISFTNPVEVAAGAEENFFILFMRPSGEATKMSKLSIVYSDESNSSTETKTTNSYTVVMPSFNNGQGYRLNVKETAEGKLVWTKAPVVEGLKVSTPAELIAALNGSEEKIALGADIALTSTLMVGRAVTLDLAGHKLSNVNDLTGFSAENALIVVKRGGQLTINDASNGDGVIEPEYDGINDKPYYTIKMVGNADTGDALAKLTVNAGRINGHHTISGTKGKGKTEIIINGGDIWAGFNGGTGIVHPQEGDLLINGGEISGGRVAIEMGAGKLELNGGRVHKNKAGYDTGIALYISQGEDNKPLNVIFNENAQIECWDDQGDWNGAYAIYEEDLYDNETDNVNIVIQGSESKTFRGITGHIYSENKKGFIGSYTAFSSPSALSYIAAGAKNVEIELESRYGDFYGPAACIPDSEEGNGAEVEVNLNGATWTIKSGDANNNYFYIGKNNSLTLLNGVVTVPEDAAGVSLIKAKDARLHFQNVTIDSYNLHYAVEIENGKVGFFRSNINAGENCYAFNIWASNLERNEPMFDLMDNCEVNGNFKLGVAELPESGEQSKAPILCMGEVVAVDGDLFVSENITNDWLYYCVHYDNVNIAEGCTGWDSVQHATDEDLPVLPVYITDPNWIAVIEYAYEGEDEFVKTDAGHVNVTDLTNKNIIESITEINFDTDYASNVGLDFSQIVELQCIDKFTALSTLNMRNTSIKELDLSKNTSLTDLILYNNQIESLNLANCTQLSKLFISNETKLTTLDLDGCSTSLTELTLNMEALTDLDISSCLSLEKLSIWNTEVKELVLPETATLTNLEVMDTPITSLNVNVCTGLKKMSLYSLTGLTSFDITNLDELETVEFRANGDVMNNYRFTSFKIDGCEKLKKVDVNFNNGPTVGEFKDCPSLISVNIPSCQTLDISGCANLTELSCTGGTLSTLDVSSCTNLEVLRCGNNKLADLILGEIDFLTELLCGSNELTTLDISNLTSLTKLDCSENHLSVLELEGLLQLQEINCSDNQITALALNDLAYLKTLKCGFNKLASLDVSNKGSLETLEYRGNMADLEVLNLSGLGIITKLNLMDYNAFSDEVYKIKELNVSNCPNLTEIKFYEGIGIETLDITGCTSFASFVNAHHAKGLKTFKLDQIHWGHMNGDLQGMTSGSQKESNVEPYHYNRFDFPEFQYPNGYSEM